METCINSLILLVTSSPWISGGLSLTTIAGIASAVFTFRRRPKSSQEEFGQHLNDSALLSPPMKRPAYSDRMAYVLAEMSDLAYYEFEGPNGYIDDMMKVSKELDFTESINVRDFLEGFAGGLVTKKNMSVDFLKKILQRSGFELLGTLNVMETQGFCCKRNVDNEPAYIVLAFRGTEKKVSDWLTDANAIPIQQGSTKVHKGFHEAFTAVQSQVEAILNRVDCQDENGNKLPIFITGHSLGGALAILATKLVASNIDGACYTFGAPRVANYEYFESVKTPIYRIVNSSDIVPRVPPVAVVILLLWLIRALSWVSGLISSKISAVLDKFESMLDKLNGYRHFGDLRHLTDVAEGRFSDVKLLLNPPMIDRVLWICHSIASNFLMPMKSHSMLIYRRKLMHVANSRNSQ